MPERREKLDFPVGERVEFSLLFDEPLEKDGDYGPYCMYTVNDEFGEERVIFATPALHRDIKETGARAGDLVTVKKLKANRGWDVESPTAESPAPKNRSSGGQSPARKSTRTKAYRPMSYHLDLLSEPMKDWLQVLMMAYAIIEDEWIGLDDQRARMHAAMGLSMHVKANFDSILAGNKADEVKATAVVDTMDKFKDRVRDSDPLEHIAVRVAKAAIAHRKNIGSYQELVNYMKDIGITSEVIVDDDDESWEIIYEAARLVDQYLEEEVSKPRVIESVATDLGLKEDDEVPW